MMECSKEKRNQAMESQERIARLVESRKTVVARCKRMV